MMKDITRWKNIISSIKIRRRGMYDIHENDKESKVNPPESSLQTIEIALAEKKSADLKEIVKL